MVLLKNSDLKNNIKTFNSESEQNESDNSNIQKKAKSTFDEKNSIDQSKPNLKRKTHCRDYFLFGKCSNQKICRLNYKSSSLFFSNRISC